MPRKHPSEIHDPKTFGDKAADKLAAFGGSWKFIGGFGISLVLWMVLNSIVLGPNAPDGFPYVFLNLILSCLAAIQAPVILMSANRQAEKDRAEAHEDYCVNQRSERDLEEIKDQLALVLAELEELEQR